MPKRKKKDVTMIDMTARLNVKITPGTYEESINFQKELDEINILVEKRMQLYEQHLHTTISSIMNDEIVVSYQDVKYFISTYEKMVENRNIENIKNRMEQYNMYLAERKNKG